jgi:predicted DNA-binding protein (UPF0251 family)
MGRCKKHRKCRKLKDEKIFKPIGVPMVELSTNTLEIDEFEAMRICDIEGKSQIEAAVKMNISRGTIQRLLNTGRYKLMDAILHSKAIEVNSKN